MILDKNLLCSDAQAITTTAVSTNVIDLGVAEDLGRGDDPALKILAIVTTTFTAGGAATLTLAVQGSVDNITFTDMAVSPAVAVADLVAGANVVRWDLPGIGAGQALPRYLRLNYTVATGPMTAGKLTAGIILDRQENHSYPAGITVAN